MGALQACRSYKTSDGQRYAPKLVFVTIQKRHGIRLFPAPGGPRDKKGNVKAGTVVDQCIVDPVMYDFVLNSHAGEYRRRAFPTPPTIVVLHLVLIHLVGNSKRVQICCRDQHRVAFSQENALEFFS